MPDISMCMNNDCPLKEKCRRHEASGTKPNPYMQAYTVYKYNSDNTCPEFMEKY